MLDPNAFLIPVPMDFSSDPAAFLAQETDATEDTDYEDVSEPAHEPQA